jgi:hypothetical protein
LLTPLFGRSHERRQYRSAYPKQAKEMPMSILKTLKLAAATPTIATSAEHGFRAKLLR